MLKLLMAIVAFTIMGNVGAITTAEEREKAQAQVVEDTKIYTDWMNGDEYY